MYLLMDTMHGVTQNFQKSVLWICICVFTVTVQGQEGSGCGHTVLGPQSGTLASQNYPGTYPSDARCEWRLRVPPGRTLRLLFGDFDVESSPDCSTGSLTVTAADGTTALGPLCGRLDSADKNVTLSSNDVTVVFRSGPHRSGRGFLLSYTTDQHPDLISCLHRGSHFIPQHFSVYCPAGCRNVSGDIWGHSEQGYRDTSLLCKASLHAGVTSDGMGGRVTVSRGRSLTRYESAFANGVLSKMGSLSEKKLLFKQECNNKLSAVGLNSSSSLWEETGPTLHRSPQNTDSLAQFPTDSTVLELADKSIITGIITEGSADFYIESYSLLFSKDRKTWKVYKDAPSKEKKVFEAHADGHLKVLNSLFPPVVARFVRLQPLAWHGSTARHRRPPPGLLQLLGCPVGRLAPPPPPSRFTTPPNRVIITPPPTRATPRPRSAGDTPPLRGNISSTARPPNTSPPTPPPTGGPMVVRDTSLSSSQPMIVAVGVVLGLVLCISCLLAGVWWKRRKQAVQMKTYSLAKAGCQSFQGKALSSCPHSELISYPLERGVHDSLPRPPLNDYAEPDMAAVVAAAAAAVGAGSGGQKVVSTFRPAPLEEGYTTPFTFNHYDTPGTLLLGPPEYAEPLPPEPEYATPFSEQQQPLTGPPEPPKMSAAHNNTTHQGHPAVKPASYDCPSHRVLSNGYCTPSMHGHAHSHAHSHGARPPSAIYAEPQ